MGLTNTTRIPYTRLRYVKSRDPDKLPQFLRSLEYRVQVYDVVFAQGAWFLWFVPDDAKGDVASGDLDAL